MVEPQTSGPNDRSCPSCSMPILTGEHVVFAQGDLIHVRCTHGLVDVMDKVEGVLRKNAGKAYCHTCLVAAIEVSFEQVRKATARLRLLRAFSVDSKNCSACGALRVTITAET